jgi:DNA-binding NtrC family response regulator
MRAAPNSSDTASGIRWRIACLLLAITTLTSIDRLNISVAAKYLQAIDDYREAERQFEIAHVEAKLREHGGNIKRTTAAIGIHHQSLKEKRRELGIQAETDAHTRITT